MWEVALCLGKFFCDQKYECVCCFQTLSNADQGNKQHLENDAQGHGSTLGDVLGLQAQGFQPNSPTHSSIAAPNFPAKHE